MIDLSIVTTLYSSEKHIKEFYERSLINAENIFKNIEIIFVNDGSPDNSGLVAEGICQRDKRVTLIELSRNFGHHKAIMTGLQYAKGELIWLIDVDLEEKPEWLKEFHEEYKTNNYDVIFGEVKKKESKK